MDRMRMEHMPVHPISRIIGNHRPIISPAPGRLFLILLSDRLGITLAALKVSHIIGMVWALLEAILTV